MPLHSKTKGEDIQEEKEEILLPKPFETNQERGPLSFSSLHKAVNPYRPPIPPTCRLREDLENKPLKMKDPGSFMVNISIGGKDTARAMLDLGASTNIMPYSIYLRLGLGKLKSTPMTLQLADGSIKCSKGIIEVLMVQVDKFKFPIEFIGLEMKGALLRHKEHMILLGRPFMATTKTVIDV